MTGPSFAQGAVIAWCAVLVIAALAWFDRREHRYFITEVFGLLVIGGIAVLDTGFAVAGW